MTGSAFTRTSRLATGLVAAMGLLVACRAPSATAGRSGPSLTPAAARTTAPPGRNAATRTAVRHDLSADETRGGHTLARHVGRSAEELRERLRRDRRVSAASSYADRAAAETAVGGALANGGERLHGWLDRSGPRPNLVLDYEGDGRTVLGLSVGRRDRRAVPCTRAVVVLRWDARAGSPYVLTSYPEASP